MTQRFNKFNIKPTFNCFTDISGIEQTYNVTLTRHNKVMLSHMDCIQKFYDSGKSLGIICDNPWSPDWIITKNGKRAMYYPMLAVEEGETSCSCECGDKIYHRDCKNIQYDNKIYI